MSSTLALEGVRKTYDGVRAVDDLTLSFGGSDGIEGVIGPNGAGKTTLFSVLSGFVRPDRGTVTMDGRRVDQLGPHQRARAGIARTFQEQEVFPTLTVGEVMTTAGLMRHPLKRARARASDLADQLMLPWSATPAELNPAEVRRLELGRVELVEPAVALFDEVIAGLTQDETEFMVSRIEGLRDRGVCVVVVEHVMHVVMTMCTQVHVLVAGQLLTSGSPKDVAADPRVIAAYLGRQGGDSA